MIILQVMSILVLLVILVLVYSAIYKMLKEHKSIHTENTDQDNLDLPKTL
jgi:uncharacterized membrane protein